MSEYTKQAEDFCKKYGVKMTISHVTEKGYVYRRLTTEWKRSTMTNGWLYRVRIDRNGKSWSFNFSDSIHNYLNNKRPTKYDVLACIEKYEPYYQDVWDFAREFGYDINSRETYQKTERIYKAVKKEYSNVVRMFDDCLEELQEIS